MAHNATALVPTESGTRSVKRSEQSTFGERHADTVADDDVIEEADVDEGQRLLDALGDEFVGLTWFGDSRRMLGFVSGCHHHLFGSVKAVHFRTLRVAPASGRGE